MSTLAQRKMTVDEFLAWAEGQEGRWELYNGVPYRMGLDTAGHCEVRMATTTVLRRECRKAGLLCHTVPRGVGVRVSPYTMHIPDCMIYAGRELPDDAFEVPNPVILIEVTSPATREMDSFVKRDGYFSLPSAHHYLIVDPDGPPVIHHRRQPDGTILRSVLHEGALTLSPPGFEVAVAELFAAA